jgi:hypothetical protein
MPIRADASRAFSGRGNVAQFRVTDKAAALIVIVQQRDFHRVPASLKPHLECLVTHCSSLSQRAFDFHAVPTQSLSRRARAPTCHF